MRNQPALTASSGTIWLVIGAVTAALMSLMFLLLAGGSVDDLPLVGVIIAITVWIGMVGARVALPHGRIRLITLAALYGTMLTASLGLTLWIAVVGPR